MGVRLYIQTSLSMVHDASGQTIGYVAVNRDITAQKKSEKHLKILAEATKALASVKPNQHEVLRIITQTIGNILCDTCIIFLRGNDDDVLHSVACFDYEPDAISVLKTHPMMPPFNPRT